MTLKLVFFCLSTLHSVFCIRKRIGIKFYTLKRKMCCIFLLPGPPHFAPCEDYFINFFIYLIRVEIVQMIL